MTGGRGEERGGEGPGGGALTLGSVRPTRLVRRNLDRPSAEGGRGGGYTYTRSANGRGHLDARENLRRRLSLPRVRRALRRGGGQGAALAQREAQLGGCYIQSPALSYITGGKASDLARRRGRSFSRRRARRFRRSCLSIISRLVSLPVHWVIT